MSSFEDLEVDCWEFRDRELSEGERKSELRDCSVAAGGRAGSLPAPMTRPFPSVLVEAEAMFAWECGTSHSGRHASEEKG